MKHITLLILLCTTYLPGSYSWAELPCAEQFRIVESFDNGARWEMCRQNTQRENLRLSDVSYQPPQGTLYRVLNSMQLSQLHVTYDDSNVTYNDITQYGLGGDFMSTLEPQDCPGGQLLLVDGRPGICLQRDNRHAQFYHAGASPLAHSFNLKSISQVGSYSYTINWTFFADGSIQPSVAAAGALQRSSDNVDSPFGRPLEGVAEKSWLSHTHNYYWRLDFDLGENADDDYVRELTLRSDASGHRRQQQRVLTTEAARETAPELLRSWEVVDGGSAERSDLQIAYSLEPINQGHKHVRAELEPFTQYDFFVTRQNDCERFASQNTRFNPNCADDVLAYVNDESLTDADIVLWHRVSFHHVPRNEDRDIMHSHWDGFQMKPRYLLNRTPGVAASLADNSGGSSSLGAWGGLASVVLLCLLVRRRCTSWLQ